MSALEQVVVPCGGPGRRLAPLTNDLPKVLVPIGGRPLLAHLLSDLARAGAGEVLLLAGHGGEQVAAEARHLAPAGLRVETVVESEPRGTAGALHSVAGRLAGRFTLVFGDVFTALDWGRLAAAAETFGGLATLLVHRTSHPADSDLVVLDDSDRAIGWISGAEGFPAPLANAAVAVLNRDILQVIPPDRPTDLFGQVLPALVDARRPVFGYRSSEYVRDLGTPDRLAQVRADLAGNRVHQKAELVLLDRDGVLVEEKDLLSRPDQLRLLPGAAAAVRRLNLSGIKAALVTNQPVVARGLCTMDQIERIHHRLEALLAEEGARIDGLYICPHHPETLHDQGLPALRGPCRCRKPSTGLVERALAEQARPAWRTVVVGDRSIDMQLAHNAGLPGIAVDTGAGCGDGQCPARPVWRFPDLAAAVDWLSGPGRSSP